MTMINAFDAGAANGLAAREQELVRRRTQSLGPSYRLFYQKPVHFVRGEGTWLYDAEGQAYLDAYNNVASVGHCHPHVVEAMTRQALQLNTHTRYLTDGIVDYAERLLQTFPAALDKVMFTCTGSEANDLAYRVACAHTGGTGFIVTELAYHGVTEVIARLSPSLGAGVTLGANVRTVPAPDTYRLDGQDVGAVFAAHVQAAVDDMLAHGITPAALLVDTIFSSDGVFAGAGGFLAPAVEVIRRAGGIFIADEVQPGFGRTGDAMWGFARHGVVPDLVTLGKPMGNGHPLAGLVGQSDILADFGEKVRYFNTYGGNPVSCAVGMAVLDVIENQGLQQNARVVGEQLRAGLRDLADHYPVIGDVRGAGLFIGAELVSDRASKMPAGAIATAVVNGMRERRVLISACGQGANILKIRPPLVFAAEQAEQFLDTLDSVLGELDRGLD
jgi:4-aminobutyrate aminotransferase-like enzyme